MRASFHQSTEDDNELKVWVRARDSDSNQRTSNKLKNATHSTKDQRVDLQANWGHGHGRYWLRSAEAGVKAVAFDEEHLSVAASFVAAELQVSHSFDVVAPIAANARITGRRRGSQLGAISFLASAAKFIGARFVGAFATHKGWGWFPGDTKSSYARPFRNVNDFDSGPLFLPWKLGDWLVKLLGVQSDLGLAWIMYFWVIFAPRLSFEPDLPPAPPSPDSSNHTSSHRAQTRANELVRKVKLKKLDGPTLPWGTSWRRVNVVWDM